MLDSLIIPIKLCLLLIKREDIFHYFACFQTTSMKLFYFSLDLNTKAKINEIYIIPLSPYSPKLSSLLTTWRLEPFSSAGSSWLIVDWGKQSMPSEVSIDGPKQGLGYRCLIYEWKYALIQK